MSEADDNAIIAAAVTMLSDKMDRIIALLEQIASDDSDVFRALGGSHQAPPES